MNSAYYDANYVFKLQCVEAGSAEVCRHAATLDVICSAQHGRAEVASAAFRKVREGAATAAQYLTFLAQVRADSAMGYLQWLPLTDSIIDRIEGVFSTAADSIVCVFGGVSTSRRDSTVGLNRLRGRYEDCSTAAITRSITSPSA